MPLKCKKCGKTHVAQYNCQANKQGSCSGDWVEEQGAAYHYTESEAKNADVTDGAGYPLWYGWALRKAFVKGIEWERSRSSDGGDEPAARINYENTI